MTSLFRPSFFAVFAILMGVFVFSSSAQAATSTVCASGCDFASLEDAITADAPGQDTLVLANGYDAAAETVYLYLPEETILTCDPGVVFGVGGSTHYVYSNNNVIVQGCSFEEARFIADNLSNNVWRNNIWTDSSTISSVNSDGLTISGNQGTLNVYLQGADIVDIRDNEIDSFYGSLLIYTSSNITVNNNIFTNNEPAYISSSWASFNEVTNLEFTSNTLRSVPITGSHFMMHASGIGDIVIRGNLFLYPEDISVINGGIQGLFLSNLYPQNVDVHFIVENNSFISHQPVAPNALTYACAEIGYGGNPGDTGHMFVQYNYNLCSLVGAQDSSVAAGIGLRTDSSLVNNLTLTDEHNGFFGMQYPVADYDNTNYVYLPSATLLNANTQYRKPVFRDENIDISDDYELVPMSTYLDANGTRDVGVFAGGPRIASYTIDDDCVVDYTTCHSQNIGVIDHVMVDGDTVTVAAGTYPGLSLTNPVSSLTVQGAGPTTILDGSLNFQSAMSLTNISDSSFSGLSLVNSTETPPIALSNTTMTLAVLSFGGNDYDDAGGVILFEDLMMNSSDIIADGDPVNVDGVTSINAFLFDFGGVYYTILAPENVADSILEMQTFVGITPTHFIEDFFIANGDGTYTYSSTNLDNQGITLAAGMTTPPTLIGNINIANSYTAAGLKLDNANNNTFENLFIGNNDVGVMYVNGATGNVIEDSLFDTNTTRDVVSNAASGINDLVNVDFTRTMSIIDDGTVRVFYDASVRVVDPLLTPLDGVGVQFLSNNGLTNINATTNAFGLTPEVETLAYLMTPSSIALTSGDYNPFMITAYDNGVYPTTSTPATLSAISVFEVMMSPAPVVVPPVTIGGGGGGLPTIDPRTGTYPPIEPVEPTAPTTPIVKETKIHMLVKLADDRNPETQEDSTVYYIGADNKRHIIPNESVFNSWYCNFSKVVITDRATLAKYPIGSNVTYRPGLNLVKFPTNPRVYVVQAGRFLRPIKDEASATAMFSDQWAKLVRDLPDTSYSDYVFGDEIPEMTDLSSLNLSPSYPSGEMSIKGYYEIVTGGQECR